MTDEQIVKGLECCVSHKGCDACEFYMHDTCFVVRHKEIYDLIKRQQAEIERLKQTPKCVFAYDGETLEYCVEGPCPAEKTIETIRAKAVREFAKRLKELAVYGTIREYSDANNMSYMLEDMVSEDIDNLVKEMTEEKING